MEDLADDLDDDDNIINDVIIDGGDHDNNILKLYPMQSTEQSLKVLEAWRKEGRRLAESWEEKKGYERSSRTINCCIVRDECHVNQQTAPFLLQH